MHQHGAFQRIGHIGSRLTVTGNEVDLDAVHHPSGGWRVAQPQPRRARLAVKQPVGGCDVGRAPLTVKNQNRFDGLHRSLTNQNHATRRPPVEIEPPGLAYQAKSCRTFQMLAGGTDQRSQQRILVAAVETQMRLHLGKRQRLRLRRMNEGIGHGVSGYGTERIPAESVWRKCSIRTPSPPTWSGVTGKIVVNSPRTSPA